jgi:hypothetical protein
LAVEALHERRKDSEWLESLSYSLSESMKIKWKTGKFAHMNQSKFIGKIHTEESKRKIGLANSENQTGNRNSQYGTMWIYNETLKETKKIRKNEPIPIGWVCGRKMKF